MLIARRGAGSSSAAAAAPAAAATELPLERRVSSRDSSRPGLAGLATQSASARPADNGHQDPTNDVIHPGWYTPQTRSGACLLSRGGDIRHQHQLCQCPLSSTASSHGCLATQHNTMSTQCCSNDVMLHTIGCVDTVATVSSNHAPTLSAADASTAADALSAGRAAAALTFTPSLVSRSRPTERCLLSTALAAATTSPCPRVCSHSHSHSQLRCILCSTPAM